ncbi:MAG: ABC transporter ATP-binding protein [Planctomycetota bacterium]|jgi:ABC-2 type transport system ATP-binding protein
MVADSILSLTDVRFTYRGDWLQKIRALNGLTLDVPAGSAFGFLGANGAGKSTSIKLVMGLLTGNQGEIRLFGQPLGPPALRARVGYLPEHPYFYEGTKVDEYLRYLGRLSGMSAAELDRSCAYIYDLLDLGDLRDRRLGSFSKGMRQRFGLAQAIVHRPDLLILDEPFSGLDPLWRARFREVMALERARGATLFFSSHILTDVEDLCDHYGLVDQGRVLESGELADLVAEAPLRLTGRGPLPGGEILRLEREGQSLEAYFVERVRQRHATDSFRRRTSTEASS